MVNEPPASKRIKYLSTAQVAEILGISRIAVFKRIRSGKLPATKVGRAYLIDARDVIVAPRELPPEEKARIKNAVERVIKEYGETLKKLGRE